jgi:acetylcholinesterase
MVFVNINYRVGPFGFLSSEKVREDGDLNAGLLDQRQALEWVQEHIATAGFTFVLVFQTLTLSLLVWR